MTIVGGLFADQTFEWGQTATNTCVWTIYLALIVAARKQTRISLVFCLVFAGLGEYALSEMWGLYDYRNGSIPLFVPPGHALLYLLGVAVSQKIPKQLVYAVPAVFLPYLGYVTWKGIDTGALVGFAVFLAFLLWGSSKRLYVTMFVLALMMEVYGTALGNWAWAPNIPYTSLTSTNPPSCAGVFYCLLDLMVISSTTFVMQRLASRKELVPLFSPTIR